jgi:hypothetical protein
VDEITQLAVLVARILVHVRRIADNFYDFRAHYFSTMVPFRILVLVILADVGTHSPFATSVRSPLYLPSLPQGDQRWRITLPSLRLQC